MLKDDDELGRQVVRDLLAEILREAFADAEAGRLLEAETKYREVLKHIPNEPLPRFMLSEVLLAKGDYEEGWELYEARTEIGDRSIQKPEFVRRR